MMKEFVRNLRDALCVAFLALLLGAFFWLFIPSTFGTAGAAPVHGVAYSRDIAKDGHPVTWQGFKSFVIARQADGTFIVSGEKLGGEAATVSLLVMDDSFSGQRRSDEGVDHGDNLSPIGTTTCRTEQSLARATLCSAVEFAPGQTGRFELTFVPADWLGNPSYTVSVDDTRGGSMNIHEPNLPHKSA